MPVTALTEIVAVHISQSQMYEGSWCNQKKNIKQFYAMKLSVVNQIYNFNDMEVVGLSYMKQFKWRFVICKDGLSWQKCTI